MRGVELISNCIRARSSVRAAANKATSSTDRARKPKVSSESDNAFTPERLIKPKLGL